MWRTRSGAHRSSTTWMLPALRSVFQRKTSCMLSFVDMPFLSIYPQMSVSDERITQTALPKVPPVCYSPPFCSLTVLRVCFECASSVPQWRGYAHAQCTQRCTYPCTQPLECGAVPDSRLTLRRGRACNYALL